MYRSHLAFVLVVAANLALTLATGCSSDAPKCELAAGAAAPDYLRRLGCQGDFVALASAPLDATIPGARSTKVVLDQFDGDALYFQNSVKYKIHYEFASKNLSGPKLPLVPSLAEFNRTQYASSERRFLLGALTYYEGPKVWALEIAPYDTASAAMITKLFAAVKKAIGFGAALSFHPTSQSIEAVAKDLPATVKVTTTKTIFAETSYQPLNLGTSIGKLRFLTSAKLGTEYLNFRDIVVLDKVPNDVSAVVGMITEEFQTPLSHVNVLAQNRHTPNMGLRGATTNSQLTALAGQWVELTVSNYDWSVRAATQQEADQWWEAHKPKPVIVPDMDLSETALKDIQYLVDESALPASKVGLREAIQKAILAYGGKAANYSILAKTDGVPVRKAFGIPVFYYDQFMRQNGFYARVDTLLADPAFLGDPAVRSARLAQLRADIEKAPVDPAFSAMLKAKLAADFPGITMRFRTSTNAEDQEDFLCAGCYDSHTGDPNNWEVDRPGCNTDSNDACSVLQAIRKTWSGVWYFRTFEERSFHSIDHKKIGMALLVHHNFPAEEANGVAVTANIFDPSGLEPGFYINAQWGGDAEVVAPPPGVTSDEFVYQFSYPGQPIVFISHSNLVPDGTTVLTRAQTYELGSALDAIHRRFSPAYGPASGNTGFYALEVDFKFDDEDTPGQTPKLLVKQARPYRGRGQ